MEVLLRRGKRTWAPDLSHASRLALLAAAVAIGAVAVRRLERVQVTGGSMAPTLLAGDRLLAVRGLAPRPGDVVTVPDPRLPSRLLVKRVAQVDGERVVVTGDAPGVSTDSRAFGPVLRPAVSGRVVCRYAPPERAGRLPPPPPDGDGRAPPPLTPGGG